MLLLFLFDVFESNENRLTGREKEDIFAPYPYHLLLNTVANKREAFLKSPDLRIEILVIFFALLAVLKQNNFGLVCMNSP